jgi:hypothetical protein
VNYSPRMFLSTELTLLDPVPLLDILGLGEGCILVVCSSFPHWARSSAWPEAKFGLSVAVAMAVGLPARDDAAAPPTEGHPAPAEDGINLKGISWMTRRGHGATQVKASMTSRSFTTARTRSTRHLSLR